MKLKNVEVWELSLEEKIKIDGGFMIPIGWIVSASIAVNEFVEDVKAAYKTLTQ